IAVSEFIKNDLLACGVGEKMITVVYNSTKEVEEVEKAYMPGDVLRIGIIGQVLKTKGHEDLIDALILLKGKMAFTLSITGTGDSHYMEILKKKISANGLDKMVNWNGYVEDKGQVYESLDVVVVPSRKNESFGLVAAESGMYYCATIVTDAGALGEIVKDGKTGFVVDKEDPAGIADRIYKLYDRQTLMEMGQNGRQRVQTLFSEKAFKSEILSALELSIKY
ncbi:MAG: glycosyltransferase family 4 protein, partial [Flavipsychrobacter sp.]